MNGVNGEAVAGAIVLALLFVISVLVGLLRARGRDLEREKAKSAELEIGKKVAEAGRDTAKASDEELTEQLGDLLARRRDGDGNGGPGKSG